MATGRRGYSDADSILKSLKYDNKAICCPVIADTDGLAVSREEFQTDIAFAGDESDFFVNSR